MCAFLFISVLRILFSSIPEGECLFICVQQAKMLIGLLFVATLGIHGTLGYKYGFLCNPKCTFMYKCIYYHQIWHMNCSVNTNHILIHTL